MMFLGLDVSQTIDIVLRLLVAAVLGGIIGYERETENKPAGFRTNMLVCIGSALVMITSQFIFKQYQGLTNLDPARLGAQVISGIGFIGAGTIIRDGLHVRGLTTAASLWVVACIGVAVGVGFYEGAMIATIFILLILLVLKKLQEKIRGKDPLRMILIQSVDEPGQLGAIGSVLGRHGASIKNIALAKLEDKTSDIQIRMTILFKPNTPMLDIFDELKAVRGVSSVREE